MRPVTQLWLPGQGVVDLEPLRIHRAVQAYDERLMFGKNEETGDWCVFVKMPHGQAPVAVLGFGRQLPEPEEAVRRCDAANTRKHGTEILDSMNRHNARIRAEKEKSDELDEAYIEIMEHAYRSSGDHPSPRVFVPEGV